MDNVGQPVSVVHGDEAAAVVRERHPRLDEEQEKGDEGDDALAAGGTAVARVGQHPAQFVRRRDIDEVEEEEEPDSEEVDGADEASDGEDTATEDPDTDSSE